MFSLEALFQGPMAPFRTEYRCYSVSLLPGNERQDVENGGKIILPNSALDILTRLNVVYPMLFKLSNLNSSRSTHCGVLEFIAEEGKMYIPHWMMRNLSCEEGGRIQIQSATLPVASFSKFEPQSVDFLDVSNPKAMLENALRTFACLTTGDIIAINYNNKVIELRVLETKPGNAVSIIECDMDVDFAPPVGYVEPMKEETVEESHVETDGIELPGTPTFIAFGGSGNRLDGKSVATPETPLTRTGKKSRGIPDYEYKVGTINFSRVNNAPQNDTLPKKELSSFLPFSGEGTNLRNQKKPPN